jgi:HEAT repeat protein
MKISAQILMVPLLVVLLTPAITLADGMFVVPKFVWDKHKDINEPTQKAILVYDAGREDLILQVKYEGPVDEFGWLIPVPNLPTVQKGSMKCFYELSQYTQRHFESPVYETRSASQGLGSASKGEQPEPPVKVIEIKTVGAYEIAVLSTKDAGALAKWLETNQFYFPTNKIDVMDAYVRQHWYFVAVKINLEKSLFSVLGAVGKLASGELNPLQISFATDRCVFPLKISSVNGVPSEVQVYVLSPEPLLERAMLEKKLPMIYSNDMARAQRSAQNYERMQLMQRNLRARSLGGVASTPADLPPSPEGAKAIQTISKTPVADPNELPPYAKVTKADLPETSKWILRLADKSWWLTKQTWTFKPEEMRDLVFEPALSVFADELGTKYGYFAVEGLAHFQAEAVPLFIAAFQSTNPVVRVNAASIFNRHYSSISDSRLTEAAVVWLKDSEPEVRMAGVETLTEYSNRNPKNAESLVAMLRDEDTRVRHAAFFALPRFRGDLEKYIPDFQQMLKDTNPGVQFSGLEMLQRLQMDIPLADLLPLFKSSDLEILGTAFSQISRQGEKISDDDARVLLQSPQPLARQLGLRALDQNPGKQSVELALPLLRDPDEIVRLKAAQTLQALTGQQFSEDQADEWAKWWVEHKAGFVAQSHPEEPRSLPDGQAYHERGCHYYDARYFADALADFRKSCELGSDAQDYSYYRIWLIRARSGEKAAATQELDSYLKNRKPHNPPDWPLQVGRFLAGQINEDDLLQAATNSNAQTDREQHCEAYFYAGSKRFFENDQAGAVGFFKKCLGTGVTNFLEYRSAEAELKHLP